MTPNLVRYYQQAMRHVYNSNPIVPEHYHDKFLMLEGELMTHQISSKHYAEAQAILWKPWVDKLELQHLPLNIFLSLAAKSRYNKLLTKPSIELPDRETELTVHSCMFEQQFAEWYFDQILYQQGIKDEGQALDTYLDTYTNENLLYAWLDYCDNFGRIQLIRRVLDHYTQLWNINQTATNYFALACYHVDKQTKLYKELQRRLKKLDWTSAEFKRVSRNFDKLEAEILNLQHGALL